MTVAVGSNQKSETNIETWEPITNDKNVFDSMGREEAPFQISEWSRNS